MPATTIPGASAAMPGAATTTVPASAAMSSAAATMPISTRSRDRENATEEHDSSGGQNVPRERSNGTHDGKLQYFLTVHADHGGVMTRHQSLDSEWYTLCAYW